MRTTRRKGQGFTGERIIDIPKKTLNQCRASPLMNHLFITRMGVYPKALDHYYQRSVGMSQMLLLYCTDGQGWVQLPHGRLTVQAGEVVAIATSIPHSYGADPINPWTIYWFHFGGKGGNDMAKTLMGERAGQSKPVQVGFSEERVALFDRVFDTLLQGYSHANLLYANLTASFFLASLILPENFRKQGSSGASASPTSKAILFMQANLSKPITLDNIAKSAHLSISRFSKKFKQDTGYSPIDYFNHLRIQKACQLLHFSELRINEVATQLGIDDSFYFSRLFKKQMGVSPVEYRKQEGFQRFS